ncbi:MAG: NAD(P)-dependent oxidoreductase [Burkholderiales bacterium]|nr:NAD(P)-dependent oxidoreductase [Burkholderiales bacterium]
MSANGSSTASLHACRSCLTVAFIGLGVMGSPMAGHLARAGHKVRVYNRTGQKAQAWMEAVGQEHGASAHEEPAEAARGADVVISCIGGDHDLRAVVAAAEPGLQAGAVWIDHSTTSAEVAAEIHARLGARGVAFVDAPVSGGNLGAVNGTLTVMCGGDADAFARVQPLIHTYARAVTLLGGPGSGQRAKMVNQICVAGLLQGLSEALAFGEKAGLDMAAVLDVISQGAAQSWQMQHRGPTMLEDRFDFGFAVDWMRKDLGLCLQEARRIGARLPATALIDQFYAELQQDGGGRWDTSSLIRLLR